MTLTLPKKYQITGLYIWCNKCKKAKKNGTCSCGSKASHVFQSRIWNPHTKRTDIIHSWPNIKEAKEAQAKHIDLRLIQLENNYIQLKEFNLKEEKPQVLGEGVRRFFDFLEDKNVPEHEIKELTSKYINEVKKKVKSFLSVLKDHNIRINQYPIAIHSTEVGLFHQWFKGQGLSPKTYRHYIDANKNMFNYFVEKGWVANNPFANVKIDIPKKEIAIFSEEEIRNLINVIIPENGFGTKGRQKRNYYKPYLIDMIKLGLFTGGRIGSLIEFKWKHVKEEFINLPNIKVNRIKKIESSFEYSYITDNLRSVLNSIPQGDSESYIIAPHRENRESLKQEISNCFTHFWNLVSDDSKSFHNLRKTNITRLAVLMGSKISLLERHATLKTSQDYYLNSAEVLKELRGKELFEVG